MTIRLHHWCFIVVTFTAFSSIFGANDRIEKFQYLQSLTNNGNYEEAVGFAQRLVQKDETLLDFVDQEVRAGILQDRPESYVQSVLAYEGSQLTDLMRKAILLYRLDQVIPSAKVFERLEASYPDNPWIQLWLARVYESSQSDSAAIRYYRLAQSDMNSRSQAITLEADLQFDLGNFAVSDSLLRLIEDDVLYGAGARIKRIYQKQMHEDGPVDFLGAERQMRADSLSSHYEYVAWMYARNDDLAAQYRVLKEAQRRWPKNRSLLTSLAVTASELGHEREPRQILSELTTMSLGFLGSDIVLSTVMELGDTLAILEEIRKSTQFQAPSAWKLATISQWLELIGRQAEADSILASAAQMLSPRDLIETRARRLSSTNPQAAIELIDSAGYGAPLAGRLANVKLSAIFAAGRSSDALRYAREILASLPGETRVYYTVALNQIMEKEFDSCLVTLANWRRVAPNSELERELRAWCYMEMGRLPESRRLTDSLASIFPARNAVLALSISQYLSDNDKAPLLKLISNPEVLESESPTATEKVVRILTTLEQYDRADSLLSDRIAKWPQSAEFHYLRGLAFYSAGNQSLSHQEFARASQLNPYEERYRTGNNASSFQSWAMSSSGSPSKVIDSSTESWTTEALRQLARDATVKPGENGVIVLSDRETWRVGFDSKKTRVVYRAALLAEERALADYGSETFAFNAWKEEPKRVAARTILADGQVFEVDPDDFMIAASDESSSSDERIVTWNYPNIQKGAIVVYEIEFESTIEDRFDFHFSQILDDLNPVLNSEFVLTIPGEWKIKYQSASNISSTQSDSAGLRTYIWSKTDLPAIEWEPSSPSIWNRCHWILGGHSHTWKQEAEWYAKKIDPSVDSTETVLTLARKLTVNCKSDQERVDSLFAFVSQNIRYLAIGFGDGPIVPNRAEEVLKTRYGDCKDKAVLLISLLRALGIKSYAAAISDGSGRDFVEEVPLLSQFDHLITYVPQLKKPYLDPTCEFCLAGELNPCYKDQPVLIIDPSLANPLAKTPKRTADDNLLRRNARIYSNDGKKAMIDMEMYFLGSTAAVVRANTKGLSSEDLDEFVKQQSGTGIWVGAKVIGFSIDTLHNRGLRYGWSATLVLDSLFPAANNQFAVPTSFNVLDLMYSLPDTSERKLDIELDELCSVEDNIRVIAHKTWELQNEQTSWEIDTAWFAASTQVQRWQDSLEIRTRFRATSTSFPKEELVAARDAVDFFRDRLRWQSPLYRQRPDSTRLGNVEKALEANADDISLAVEYAETLLSRDWGGNSCLAHDRRARVIPLMAKAYAKEPDDEMLLARLIGLMIRNAAFRDADTLLQNHLKTHANSLVTDLLDLSIASALHLYERMRIKTETYLRSTPTDKLRAAMISVYSKLGMFDKAQEQLQILETLRADSTQLLSAKVEYYRAKNDPEMIDKLLAQWPDTSKMTKESLKQDIYLKRQDYEHAYNSCAEILKRYPDNPTFLNNAAWSLAWMKKDLKRALEMIDRALTLQGSCDSGYRNTRGFVLLQMGRVKEAEAEFLASLEDQSASSTSSNLYFLGEICRMRNQIDKARGYYTSLTAMSDIEPFDTLAKESLAALK